MSDQISTDELLAKVPLFKDLSKKHLLARREPRHPPRSSRRPASSRARVQLGHEFIVVLDGEVDVRVGDQVVADPRSR